ncbi:AMP-binding protein [Robbsia sp. KACC 23696]|uniref:AMP-binding protein n=1 Tax=Robbsia sp. KACC 23696 TaxID=3149231 RepID=UPI00325B33D9
MDFATLDAPLAHWASQFPNRIALDDGTRQLTFAALHRAVSARAAYLRDIAAPQHVWLDAALWADAPETDAQTALARDPADSEAGGTAAAAASHDDPIARLRDFLAIIHSGRAAAVADDDWPQAVRGRLADALADTPSTLAAPSPLTPFYVGFTSGSTGLPKGFRRHHRSWVESLRAALDAFGPGAQSRVFCPGRLSHSLFLFGALQGLWTGAGVVLQPRFSAARALQTLRDGEHCVVAVPSQLALMLDVAARRKLAPLEGVTLVMISGARWMRERTPALRALFPNARIIEFYGASETSFVAWTDADDALPGAVVGRPFATVDLRIAPLQPPSTDGAGLIFVRSPMLFNDYVYAAAAGTIDDTAAVRETGDAQGDWLSVRDVGYLDDVGRLCLIGRAKRMLVTQGKNLFPEEVEAVLRAHPWVDDASVHGVPDAIRGRALVAAVRWRQNAGPSDNALMDETIGAAIADGDTDLPPSAAELARWCRARLEPYKTPRRFFVCTDNTAWPCTTSGKTDHPTLAARLDRACAAQAAIAAQASAGSQRSTETIEPADPASDSLRPL